MGDARRPRHARPHGGVPGVLAREQKRYAVEVKTSRNFAGEKSYGQLADYLGTLGLSEGWMPIFDEDKAKAWDEKLFTRDETFGGKTIHVVGL